MSFPFGERPKAKSTERTGAIEAMAWEAKKPTGTHNEQHFARRWVTVKGSEQKGEQQAEDEQRKLRRGAQPRQKESRRPIVRRTAPTGRRRRNGERIGTEQSMGTEQ